MALALAYPSISVRGIDLDEASVAEARRNAADAGVVDRVSFAVGDAANVSLDARFDLVTIFEALHDMADPVAVLRAPVVQWATEAGFAHPTVLDIPNDFWRFYRPH